MESAKSNPIPAPVFLMLCGRWRGNDEGIARLDKRRIADVIIADEDVGSAAKELRDAIDAITSLDDVKDRVGQLR